MSAQSSEGTGKSPVIAALLGMLYPGLGHIYLRRWGRALMWSWLFIATLVVLMPEAILPASLSLDGIVSALASIFSLDAIVGTLTSVFSLEAVGRAQSAAPFYVAALLFLISTMSIIDAYWIAAQSTREAVEADETEPETRSCPHCGKELDEDLDFCHWCTTELDADGA